MMISKGLARSPCGWEGRLRDPPLLLPLLTFLVLVDQAFSVYTAAGLGLTSGVKNVSQDWDVSKKSRPCTPSPWCLLGSFMKKTSLQ